MRPWVDLGDSFAAFEASSGDVKKRGGFTALILGNAKKDECNSRIHQRERGDPAKGLVVNRGKLPRLKALRRCERDKPRTQRAKRCEYPKEQTGIPRGGPIGQRDEHVHRPHAENSQGEKGPAPKGKSCCEGDNSANRGQN